MASRRRRQIIIIGKTALFEPQSFFDDYGFCYACLELDHLVFTSLDFTTIII
jgi:hypothetical protein